MNSKELLPRKVAYLKLPIQYRTYELSNSSEAWINEILEEISSADSDYSDFLKEPPSLKVELNLKRAEHGRYEHYALASGTITSKYYLPCIKCLIPCLETLEVKFNAIYMLNNFEKSEEIIDRETLFLDGHEQDLYFYDGKTIDLRELVREQVLTSLSEFPIHDENCKGLCPECGTNWNLETCEHQH